MENIKQEKTKKELLKEEGKKIKTFYEEFKKFISKGNVVDLAVAVVIGNAFNKIITSLVNDIIMPLVGIIIGGIDFTEISVTIGSEQLMIGTFIQNIVDFLIIAMSIFVVIKVLTKFTPKHKEETVKEVKKSDDVILLEEIRDLLKENK